MAKQNQSLPPLNALKVFDAVARLGSMNKAAAELHISPSSVTQHVRNVEVYFNAKLVDRTPNSMELTAFGKSYARQIRPAFDIITSVTETFSETYGADSLVMSCAPSLANSWLASQLAALKEKFPNIAVCCDFTPAVVDFDREEIDIAIRYGAGHYPDADADLLFVDKVAPVCREALSKRVKFPDDLLTIERLSSVEHTEGEESLWEYWGRLHFTDEFAKKLKPDSASTYRSSRFTAEALKISDAIAILDHTSVYDDLQAGHLICPLGRWVDAPFGYYMLTPKRRSIKPAVKVLKSLLRRNATNIRVPETRYFDAATSGAIAAVGLNRQSVN